jgi:hypothetical protein
MSPVTFHAAELQTKYTAASVTVLSVIHFVFRFILYFIELPLVEFNLILYIC